MSNRTEQGSSEKPIEMKIGKMKKLFNKEEFIKKLFLH